MTTPTDRDALVKQLQDALDDAAFVRENPGDVVDSAVLRGVISVMEDKLKAIVAALTAQPSSEALVKRIERIEAFRREQFIPQAGDAEYGEPWQLEHNEILAECCDAAIAALTAQSGEQTAVAWLICRADGSRDVVLSPLTDDTPMDYGDEAWPLVHQSSMPDSTDGQTADTVSVPDAFGCDNEARKGKACLRWCGRAECPASGPIAEACKKAVDNYIYDFSPDLDYRGEFSERLYAYKIGFLDGFAAAKEGK